MRNTLSAERVKILSGSWLKLLAVFSMLIDHSAYILWSDSVWMCTPLFKLAGVAISPYYLLRQIGRLAFPIFCFLVAEGYLYTRNKIKYGRNLLLFALLSEIPFNLMMGNQVLYPDKQNVYFTLFLGLLLMTVSHQEWGQLRKALGYIGISLVAVVLNADYGLRGALLVLLLYALREKPALRAILAYPMLSGGAAAFAAFLPISLYNGQRGFVRSKWMKYAFYLFYPIHILLLWMVKAHQ